MLTTDEQWSSARTFVLSAVVAAVVAAGLGSATMASATQGQKTTQGLRTPG